MTNRQARTERRAAERKAKKAEMKRLNAAGLSALPPVPALPGPEPLEEYSDDVMAELRAARERHRLRIAADPAAISKRAEINRANAQHSTGPKSINGKLASSRNSLKHGLASGQLIVPGENPAAFDALRRDLLEEHCPANPTEDLLVNQMAQSWWLAQRAIRLQSECFAESAIDEKRLALYLRYGTTHDRAFHKALNTLLRLQKERRKNESHGFVSQHAAQTPPPEQFVRQNAPSLRSQAGFVSQNRPANPSPDPLEASQAA